MRILGLAVIASLLLLSSAPARARANLSDPRYSNVWGLDFGGTYYFHGNEFPAAWMKSAINRANATIGHGDARNPDFHVTTSTSANGVVHYMSSATNDCDLVYNWRGCADAYPDRTFRLWLASNACWTDGTNSTCGGTRYDVETVALNEMGHVNRLGHHVNPDYADAVVQADVYPYGSSTGFGTNRALRWADHQALHALYGTESCPCPQGAEP